MGVRLLVRTDLRNDKDKRSLRLAQEVSDDDDVSRPLIALLASLQGISIINKYFTQRRIQLEEQDMLPLLSHAFTYFSDLSQSVQNQLEAISHGPLVSLSFLRKRRSLSLHSR